MPVLFFCMVWRNARRYKFKNMRVKLAVVKNNRALQIFVDTGKVARKRMQQHLFHL